MAKYIAEIDVRGYASEYEIEIPDEWLEDGEISKWELQEIFEDQVWRDINDGVLYVEIDVYKPKKVEV